MVGNNKTPRGAAVLAVFSVLLLAASAEAQRAAKNPIKVFVLAGLE